ncbi:MAG: LON peptidase substrate-binding domain-containing protein [Bacteroidales bacterium]
MSKILNNFPLFPIGVIVLPGEIQPLHVFEPRYKQLIGEMKGSGKVFGIPFIKDGKMCEYGSAVVLHKILATSPSGEMDILVRGVYLFRIKDIKEQLPQKLYGGGSVEVLDQLNEKVSDKLSEKYRTYKEQLASINSQKSTELTAEHPNQVLDIAGQLPLDIEEKYEMIKSASTQQREQFLLEKLEFLLMINKKLEEVGYRFYLN